MSVLFFSNYSSPVFPRSVDGFMKFLKYPQNRKNLNIPTSVKILIARDFGVEIFPKKKHVWDPMVICSCDYFFYRNVEMCLKFNI